MKKVLAIFLVLVIVVGIFVSCDTDEINLNKQGEADKILDDYINDAVKDNKNDKNKDNDPDDNNGSGNNKELFSPLVRINPETKEWEISNDGGKTWTSTGISAVGGTGANGTDGTNGTNGAAGRGILKTEIIDGELWVTYNDDPENPINVGVFPVTEINPYGLDFYPLPDGTYGVGAGKSRYLDNVVIPETYNKKPVTRIMPNAFSDATNLKEITLPSTITVVSANAFSCCEALQIVRFDGKLSEWCKIKFDGDLSTPMKYAKQFMLKTESGDYASPVDLVIPNDVDKIEDFAFYNCDSIKTLKLHNNLIEIGRSAFENCEGIESVVIPDSVEKIGHAAFSRCNNLKIAIVGNSVEDLPDVFLRCTNLMSITIGEKVNSFGERRFNTNYRLVEVINKSQCECPNRNQLLEEHTGESKLKKVGNFYFYSVDHVNYLVNYDGDESNVELPQDYNGEAYVINERALMDKDNIVSIFIPETVTGIQMNAFSDCNMLESITVDENNPAYKAIDGVLYTKDEKILIQYPIAQSNTSYTVSENVRLIYAGAFLGAANLTDVIFEVTDGWWCSFSENNQTDDTISSELFSDTSCIAYMIITGSNDYGKADYCWQREMI